tara:strand:- start:75 stop:527 length:453 start_codon:yes stop_codon:yes gene_type:complete
MTKLIPKNKRLLESINATEEDISKLYKVVMLYNLSMYFEKKLFKKPRPVLNWCNKEHKKIIKSIKSPFRQFKFKQMHDGIFYTVDGIPVALRHILKNAKNGEEIRDYTNMQIYKQLEQYLETDKSGSYTSSSSEAWHEFGNIFTKYSNME